MDKTQTEKLEGKINKLDERLDSIEKHLAVYNSELKIHIEGTNLNREEIKILRTEMSKKISPIETHFQNVQFLWRVLVIFGTIIAFVIGTVLTIVKN